MKRLSTGVLVALFAAGLGLNAVAAPSTAASLGNSGTKVIAQATSAPPPADFGSPPSGQIPILFNDHHVYAKPDVLKQGRVLAALVRGGTILVPLRSMFEQMGATVSYDPATKTADVTKAGSDVKVTVGRPEVTINGETRPLDVPPIMYQGNVLVPVRVISEGMGAYVQWVPDKKLVAIRYVPASAATAPPAPAPVVTPAPTAAPAPAVIPYLDKFIVGDYIISPKIYNEFSPGNSGRSGNYAVRGGLEFSLFNLPWMLEADYRTYRYPHNQGVGTPPGYSPNDPLNNACTTPGDQGCVTVIGGQGQTFVPAFTVRDYDFDGRLGLKVASPRIYVGLGYMQRSGNYGYPHLKGIGFGLEKLPDLDQAFSVYGSAYYYPKVRGTYTVQSGPQSGTSFDLSYRILKYAVGGTFTFGRNVPVYLDFGFLGDKGTNQSNAPIDFTHNGPFVGIGIKF
ncbi:MAG: copper amine oxidase N-terminal domain-containing protein [Candidatus Eremiobacteraeota bacterium]|nr:copper amine oxidase N-terminal domain-containing protein [Candidatus Eremiobacteraeota bacterium]